MGFISNAAFPGVKAGKGRTLNPPELPLFKKAMSSLQEKLKFESQLYFCDVLSEISSALNRLENQCNKTDI